MDKEVSHSIIRFDPNRSRQAIVSIASRYVLDMIMLHVIQGDAEKLREWYSMFLTSPFSKSTAGWILNLSSDVVEKGTVECL